MKIIDKIYLEIQRQYEDLNQPFVTPYTVAKGMGYKLSGRISHHLKKLEEDGFIIRTYKTANECFIDLVEDAK